MWLQNERGQVNLENRNRDPLKMRFTHTEKE